jgi:hypothetical protein
MRTKMHATELTPNIDIERYRAPNAADMDVTCDAESGINKLISR